MARLFGYFANQRERLGCALTAESAALSLEVTHANDGWGVGSYQSGEVLMRKRPVETREGVDLMALTRDLKTDCAVIHFRNATIGPRTLDNTHPFRYRQWLFAHNGSWPTVAAARDALREAIPDFLMRNVRGETDSELVFHLVLASVHRMGRLDDPDFDRHAMVQAVREAVESIDTWTEKAGAPSPTLNIVFTNGTAMVAVRHGLPLAWTRRSGIRDCAACRVPPDIAGREPKRVDHEAFRYVIAASDHGGVPAGWFEVPDAPGGVALAVDRTLDVQVVPLRAA